MSRRALFVSIVGRFAGLCCLTWCILAVGCTPKKTSIEHAEVSGKVLYKGQPLPGGRVTFLSTQGGFANTGNIDEKGNYKVKAPVGEVQIGVDNRMLYQRRGAPSAKPTLKRPGAEEAQPIKGRAVHLPSKYFNPSESGLKYTVQNGPQTHDIRLD